MRLPTLVALLTLLFAASASADVTNVTGDPSEPSAAAGARTVYRVGLTVNTALSGSDAVRVVLPGDAAVDAWQSGTLRNETRGVDVGSCARPNAVLIATCTLFSGQTIAAGDRLKVTLRGITNPPTAGIRGVGASTTAESVSVGSPPFAIVAGGTVSQPTLAIADPSAAAGAVTRYVVGFTVAGGLSAEAGSQVMVTLPAGTRTDDWQSGTIRSGTTDVGSCARPVGGVSTCSLFSGASVAAGAPVQLVLRGLTNGPAGGKTVLVSTTSDLPTVTSTTAQVVAGDAVTTPVVTIGDPSASTGAVTRYVLGFDVSATGGLSGEAGSRITVELPQGTGTDDWQSGTIRDLTRNVDVGSCARPDEGVSACAFFSGGFVAPGDRLQITLRGLTNSGIGAKTLTVRTSSDLPDVTSQPFEVLGGNVVSTPTVTVASPSPAAGAVTRYVVGFRVSATGGLSGDAGSEIAVTLPAGTGTETWQSGTIRDVTRGVDVGSCAVPAGGVSRCGFFSGGYANAGDRLELTLRGLTNGAAGAKTVSVATTSDLPAVSSTPFAIVAGGTLTGVSLRFGAPSEVRLVTSPTGGLSAEAGSRIRLTFPPGTAFAGTTNGTVHDVTRAVDVGSCGMPSGTAVSCGFYSSAFVNPGDVLRISFPAITAPSLLAPLTASTTSDLPDVESGGAVVEPTPTPTPTPTAEPTAVPTVLPTVVATPAHTATPAPPTPTPTPNAEPTEGTVRIKAPGAKTYTVLDPATGIPLGSTVDTKQGAVMIRDGDGGQAQFSDGIFKLSRAGGVTVLTLVEPLAPCKQASAAKQKAKSRKLWGDGKGSFRTAGKYSAATVRGTRWLVQDSCAGTLTRVTQGAVTVRDRVKGKTVVVRAGKKYLARVR